MSVSHRIIPLALLCGASTLNAATPNRIEQIIVSGVRTEQLALNSPAAVSVITREDIEKSGALTVAEVLRGRAGLQIRDTIGDGGRGVVVSMRGFGENAPNNTLVLVDGRRLNNPTLAGPDLNSVALKDIERIEILQGGAGVMFGDQAVGGVINVITRTPDKAAVALEAGGGSHDSTRYALSASQRFANGIGVRLSAEQRESDNYRDNNATEYTNALGLLEYNWSDGRVFAELQQVDDNLELPGALSRSARAPRPPPEPAMARAAIMRDLETTTWRLGGRYALTPVWSAEMEITERENDGDGYQSAPNTTEMRVTSANPRLVGRFERPAGTATLTLGFDATDSKYLLDIPEFSFQTDFARSSATATPSSCTRSPRPCRSRRARAAPRSMTTTAAATCRTATARPSPRLRSPGSSAPRCACCCAATRCCATPTSTRTASRCPPSRSSSRRPAPRGKGASSGSTARFNGRAMLFDLDARRRDPLRPERTGIARRVRHFRREHQPRLLAPARRAARVALAGASSA